MRGVIVDSGCRIPDGMVVDQSGSRELEPGDSGRVEPVVLTAQAIAEAARGLERDQRLMAGAGC